MTYWWAMGISREIQAEDAAGPQGENQAWGSWGMPSFS